MKEYCRTHCIVDCELKSRCKQDIRHEIQDKGERKQAKKIERAPQKARRERVLRGRAALASGVRHSAPPPKPTSLGTFLFGDKKVPRRRHPIVSELFSINRIMLRKPDNLNAGLSRHTLHLLQPEIVGNL